MLSNVYKYNLNIIVLHLKPRIGLRSLRVLGVKVHNHGVKDLFCEENIKLTASSFETGLYSVKLCEALNTTDEKAENLLVT